MARYLHSLLPGVWSASSSAPDYPPANLSLPRILRPWRSASGASTTITIDLGAAQSVAGIYVADWNSQDAAALHSSPNNSTWTARGTVAAHDGPAGRRNGLLVLPSPLAERYWRLTLAGSRSDGAAYWRAGYIQLYGEIATLPRPRYAADVRLIRALWPTQQLPGGLTIQAEAGPTATDVRLPFRQGAGLAVEQFARRAAVAPVLLDLDMADRTGWYWPVRSYDPQIDRQLQGHQREITTLTLREIV